MRNKLTQVERAALQAKRKAVEAEPVWRGRCRHCGATLKGTIADIGKHRCEDGQSGRANPGAAA